MGGRLLENRVLSDDAVIARLNENYVSVLVNITDDGWPENVPALAPFRWGYDVWPFSKLGFVNALVCDSAGKIPLAWAGSGMKSEFMESANYHPALFLEFLDRADEHGEYVKGVRGSTLPKSARRKLLLQMLAGEFRTDEAQVDRFIRKNMGEDALE